MPAGNGLRTIARAALVAGAGGSIALMLHAGSRQQSFISLSTFTLDALRGPHAQAAFVYVVVPAACWLLIAVAFATAAVLSPKSTRP